MNTAATPSVVVVMVTYGDRYELCIASIRAAASAGAKTAIVVVNGSSVVGLERLRGFARSSPVDVELVEFAANQGSAVAFAVGLEVAQAKWNPEFFWLLDDDNAPAPDCLSLLLAAHRLVAGSTGALVFARRGDSPVHSAVLASGAAAFPPPGSFIYFDLFQRCSRLLGRPTPAPVEDLIPVPYGPYGGLLVDGAAIRRIGLPESGLVLYEDDTEFTSRASAKGVGCYLCASAVIRDLDPHWLAKGGPTGPARLLSAEKTAGAKVFYSTRNRVLFDKYRATREGAVARFYMNGFLYVGFLLIDCLIHRRLGQLILMLRAIKRGATGTVGPDQQFKLSSGQMGLPTASRRTGGG